MQYGKKLNAASQYRKAINMTLIRNQLWHIDDDLVNYFRGKICVQISNQVSFKICELVTRETLSATAGRIEPIQLEIKWAIK